MEKITKHILALLKYILFLGAFDIADTKYNIKFKGWFDAIFDYLDNKSYEKHYGWKMPKK
jgi:hypothetical protein